MNQFKLNLCYVQIDPKTTYLLNGLYKSVWIWPKPNFTQSKPIKGMLNFIHVEKLYQILPPLMGYNLLLSNRSSFPTFFRHSSCFATCLGWFLRSLASHLVLPSVPHTLQPPTFLWKGTISPWISYLSNRPHMTATSPCSTNSEELPLRHVPYMLPFFWYAFMHLGANVCLPKPTVFNTRTFHHVF